jgi:hypothetical protein
LRTRKTFQNHSVFSQVGWLKPFSSRLHPCSRDAGNYDCVSENFKSLTILLISCCVMRGGDIDVSGKKQSGSWLTILVVVPCLLSDKLYCSSSLMTQSLGALKWENRHEGLAVLPRANSGIECRALILQRSLLRWSNKNNTLWCNFLFTLYHQYCKAKRWSRSLQPLS